MLINIVCVNKTIFIFYFNKNMVVVVTIVRQLKH